MLAPDEESAAFAFVAREGEKATKAQSIQGTM
jgi:hypothetical protein